MSVIKTVDSKDGAHRVIFSCPGCKGYHQLKVRPASSPSWEYNNNPAKPTFTPSILATVDFQEGKEICHSFITDGRIQFLNDCTHELAGQTVDLPEWPHARGTFGGIID